MTEEIAAVDATNSEADKALPRVLGQPLDKLPEDLYIPPDALQVVLEAFEGPLDLLLYLIRRQNLNILDIPVYRITQQYMEYIALMEKMRFELAAEYLVMAALLAEIKSRLLLPRPPPEIEEEGDPRMELVRRLQEYERFKTAGENIEAMPRMGRDLHVAQARPEIVPTVAQIPTPSLRELLMAFKDAMSRADLFTHHHVSREPLSVRERMTHILARVRNGPQQFFELVDPEEGRIGVVVVLLAVLELVKGAMVDLTQEAPFAPVTIAVKSAESEDENAHE
ncbi:MAG TPA: ScpA family protein [Nevskiaceae bacterium]|nr:ScpA family protein [Nevskiaceae bacterium]